MATRSVLPKKCRRKFGGTKERILEEAYESIEKSMRIDNLLKSVRVSTYILKKMIGKEKWRKKKHRHGFVYST